MHVIPYFPLLLSFFSLLFSILLPLVQVHFLWLSLLRFLHLGTTLSELLPVVVIIPQSHMKLPVIPPPSVSVLLHQETIAKYTGFVSDHTFLHTGQPHVPPLDIYLINDSPNVLDGSVQAEFETTRPVAGVRCYLRSQHSTTVQPCTALVHSVHIVQLINRSINCSSLNHMLL